MARAVNHPVLSQHMRCVAWIYGLILVTVEDDRGHGLLTNNTCRRAALHVYHGLGHVFCAAYGQARVHARCGKHFRVRCCYQACPPMHVAGFAWLRSSGRLASSGWLHASAFAVFRSCSLSLGMKVWRWLFGHYQVVRSASAALTAGLACSAPSTCSDAMVAAASSGVTSLAMLARPSTRMCNCSWAFCSAVRSCTLKCCKPSTSILRVTTCLTASRWMVYGCLRECFYNWALMSDANQS